MSEPGEVCPKCGSETIDVYDEDRLSDSLYAKSVCEDCGTQWTAHYRLVFVANEDVTDGD